VSHNLWSATPHGVECYRRTVYISTIKRFMYNTIIMERCILISVLEILKRVLIEQ
jgi:hypothetical protein